jgi:hypothetical protein
LNISPTSKHPSQDRDSSVSLEPAAAEIILELMERIRQLEASHTELCVDLEAARDALVQTQETKTSYKRCSVVSVQSHATQSASSTASEPKSKEELRVMLKSSRAEVAQLSRLLREQTERADTSMTKSKEEERSREIAEADIKRLSDENAMLSVHNETLEARDKSLQDCLDSVISEFHKNEWSIGALKMRLTRQSLDSGQADDGQSQALPPFDIPTEILTLLSDLRQNIWLLIDELLVTRTKLGASERERLSLVDKVASTQQDMRICVDEAAKALEVERELRVEMEMRVHRLLTHMVSLGPEFPTMIESSAPNEDGWSRKQGKTPNTARESGGPDDEAEPRGAQGRAVTVKQLQRTIWKLTKEVELYKQRERHFKFLQRELRSDLLARNLPGQVGHSRAPPVPCLRSSSVKASSEGRDARGRIHPVAEEDVVRKGLTPRSASLVRSVCAITIV